MDWTNPTRTGDVVLLRPFNDQDIDPAWEMLNDPVGKDLTNTRETFQFEQIRGWYLSRNAAVERLDLAVVERASGEFVGEVVLNEFNPGEKSCSFRISLRGPEYFGRGFGTEATALIVGYGFEELGLERITLEVLARNPRARRVYDKVGFEFTHESVEDDEAWVYMALTAARWRNLATDPCT